ncbi:MAG: enoyl-CoA hydratase/isomerase family protein [Muribaculaceae bacterium]|nr:enoyl-CoA hydratase/isomerase family protein [Muribaculaceae bacterium]
MEYNFLKIEQRGAITVMMVSAPKTLNALNSSILKEISHFVGNLNTTVTRVLIITGDGEKSFVAGADISEMAHLGEAEGRAFGVLGAQVFRAIEQLPIPVIAAVNGFALGGGCELAMACDFRIASNKAKFGQPEVGLGIIPGFSGTVRLPRLVGQGMAKEMIYTGRVVRADEALRIGLVNAIYEPEELMDKAIELAETMLRNAPLAIQAAKQSISQGYDLDVEAAIALENDLFGHCFTTQDQKDGMAAFLEKRKPTFNGK